MTLSQQLMDLQSFQLAEGARKLGFNLSSQQHATLSNYLQLLHKWNKAFNLTAVRDPAEHVSRHLLDSLALLPLLNGSESAESALLTSNQHPHYLDVGTGPGFPGLPLAVTMPHAHWYLLDSNGKKTRFLAQCKMELSLDNIDIVHARVEDFQLPRDCYLTGITSRAFATLRNFATAVDSLMSVQSDDSPGTRLFAMKGEFPKNEVSELPNDYKICQIEKLRVPGCEGERHLLIVAKCSGR